MEKLILIDGNSLLNRAFYATPVFTTKDGKPTNGVFGFVKLLLKIISDKNPTHIAVAFDVHAPTFRHTMYGDYKAGRKPMPEDLAVQFPVLKEVLALMNIRICEMPGHEADDIIGTLAKRFSLQTYIYTGDRDSYQLVDETTSVCYTKKGVSDLLELSSENFKDEIGLTPTQIIDLKALMGDKSDNIPGVAGIGEKTAYGLLESYHDLDGIYAHIDEIKGATQKKLIENKETAYFSRTLATIELDAPIDVTLTDCLLKTPFPHALKEKFAELEFKSLLTKNIFSEQEDEEVKSSVSPKEIAIVNPETVEEAIALIENSKAETISCLFGDNGIQFYLEEDTEYQMPIKTGLLDVGFYDFQLIPLLERIYSGQKRVISYNAKEILHRLKEVQIPSSAPFEDVSILKCLADGLSNSDSLEYCLQYFSLPEKCKAYGLFYLYKTYSSALREEEKKLYREVELPLVRVFVH